MSSRQSRRLQQRVHRPLMLGQVLVKVTEETRVPFRISEIVNDLTGILGSPEGHQVPRRIVRDLDPAHRAVARVQHARHQGMHTHLFEPAQDPVTVTSAGVLPQKITLPAFS